MHQHCTAVVWSKGCKMKHFAPTLSINNLMEWSYVLWNLDLFKDLRKITHPSVTHSQWNSLHFKICAKICHPFWKIWQNKLIWKSSMQIAYLVVAHAFPLMIRKWIFFSQSTAIILIISVAFGILFAIIVMCCYIKCCPWNGNCERGWKNY